MPKLMRIKRVGFVNGTPFMSLNASENLADLAAALCAVQGELKPAIKQADNPFFKSKYVDLPGVWEAIRPLLAKNGLSVVQTFTASADGPTIVTTLMHKSGQWVSSELFLKPAKSDPQGVGSAITYGRRYALAAMVGVVADEDDDGNAASQGQAYAAAKVSAPFVPCSSENAAKLSEYAKIKIGSDAIEKALSKYNAVDVTELDNTVAAKVIAFIQKEMNK